MRSRSANLTLSYQRVKRSTMEPGRYRTATVTLARCSECATWCSFASGQDAGADKGRGPSRRHDSDAMRWQHNVS